MFVGWMVRRQIDIKKGRANEKMKGIKGISDEFLVEACIQATEMGLDLNFRSFILEEEIKLRKLDIDDYQAGEL